MSGDSKKVPAPVVFVGNATEDSVFFVDHLPSNDEVSSAQRNVRCLGGRGVVPALVAAALGMRTELCTVIGEDRKSTFTPFLSANGVGTSGVKWDVSNSGATQYVAFVSSEAGTSMAVAHRPTLDWRSLELQRDLVGRAPAVYFSTNNLRFNRELLSCLTADVPVLHNLGLRLGEDSGYLELVLEKCTVIIGNLAEMTTVTRLTGWKPEDMLARSRSLQHVIVTAGRNGVVMFCRGSKAPVEYSAIEVEHVRSPVGAGDSFAVGVLLSLLSGTDIHRGIGLGMKLGALAAQSDLSYPDLRAVSETSW